jgi:hypothetical protein
MQHEHYNGNHKAKLAYVTPKLVHPFVHDPTKINPLECATRNNDDATFQNPPLTYKTSIYIAFQNLTQIMPMNLSSHNLSHGKSVDPTFHNLSTKV